MYVDVGSTKTAIRTPIPTNWNGNTTLREGSTGQHVKDLQNMLNSAGYKLSSDGHFGTKTYDTLVSFQKKAGITADGIAGSSTYSKLKNYHVKTTVTNNGAEKWSGQTLKDGSSGQAVKELQTLLNKHGFNAGSVDGKYGDGTEAAVKRFQAKTGLKADGVAGSDTYDKLIRYQTPSSSSTSSAWTGQTLKEGSSGNAVKALQTMLEKAGFDIGSIDGNFGAKTEAGVKAFQKKVGIASDGIAGNQTYAYLKSYNPYKTYTPPKTQISNTVIQNFEKDLKSLNSNDSTMSDLFQKAKAWSKEGFDLVIGDDLKTLFNPEANAMDRTIAGLSLLPQGKLLKIGSAAFKVIRNGSKVEIAADVFSVTRKGNAIDVKNPVLENIRTGSATKTDALHAFNDIIDNYVGYAREFDLEVSTQKDGIPKKFYQIEGSLNGKVGVFEWIVHPHKDKGVTHRRFIEGVGITGQPNARKK